MRFQNKNGTFEKEPVKNRSTAGLNRCMMVKEFLHDDRMYKMTGNFQLYPMILYDSRIIKHQQLRKKEIKNNLVPATPHSLS